MKIYQNSPDVFELIVNTEFCKNFTFKQIETAWGLDETKFCYFNEILIGEVFDSANNPTSYYTNHGIQIHLSVVIKLTPSLEYNKEINFPLAMEFCSIFENLLFNLKGWILLCESDCDQYDIDEVEFNSEVFLNHLKQLRQLFLGESSECPTFITRTNRL